MYILFQSTPPRRRRLRRKRLCYRVNQFQSTPPRRRRLESNHLRNQLKQFQSTPPRRRRPETILQRPALLISIHASAKEATNSSPSIISTMSFQSTPPRRRRLIVGNGTLQFSDDFNPRLREGGDIYNHFLFFSIGISIHASAKEATFIVVRFENILLFQSTPPRRRRRGSGTPTVYTPFDFNPRLREGGDNLYRNIPILYNKFQSTPPRRRRLIIPLKNPPTNDISIHASAKEATISFSQVMV